MTFHRIGSAFAIASLLASAACVEKGSGVIVKRTSEIDSFRHLDIEAPAVVRVADGPAGKIRIETDDNLIDRIGVRIEGDTLRIGVLDSDEGHCWIDPTRLDVTISGGAIESVSIDGTADVVLDAAHSGDSFDLEIDGSGSLFAERELSFASVSMEIDGSGVIEAVLDAQDVSANIDGSADLVLAGRTIAQRFEVDGSAAIESLELISDTTAISVDGSADISVTALQELKVDIDGSGSIRYCGSPSVARNVDGSGSIEAADRELCPGL